MIDPNDLERLISPHRFATYVTECAGDRQKAVELYHWTGQLAGALTEDFRSLEVIFRNALHNAITAYHSQLSNRPAGTSWFDEPKWVKHHWWNKPAQAAIDDARRRTGHHPPAKSRPDAVVAVPGANSTDRRLRVEDNIKALHKLRNRIAHHEPLFKPTNFFGSHGIHLAYTVADQSEMLFEVLDWIDNDCASWARANSPVAQLLAAQPTA